MNLDFNNEEYNFRLMWTNKIVLDFTFTVCGGSTNIKSINKIHNPQLLPTALKNNANVLSLENWFIFRTFSMGRKNAVLLTDILMGFPYGSSKRMLNSQILINAICYGVNLTDKYWITPIEDCIINTDLNDDSRLDNITIKTKTYENVNYFLNNKPSTDCNTLFIRTSNTGICLNDYFFPDICTDSTSKSRWIQKDGIFYYQKVFDIVPSENDSDLMEKIHFLNSIKEINSQIIPQYYHTTINPYNTDTYNVINSKCFTGKNTELISAYDIVSYNLHHGHEDLFEHLRLNYLELGFDESQFKILEEVIIKVEEKYGKKINDYTNFGFIKDINTGKIIKPIIWSDLYEKRTGLF